MWASSLPRMGASPLFLTGGQLHALTYLETTRLELWRGGGFHVHLELVRSGGINRSAPGACDDAPAQVSGAPPWTRPRGTAIMNREDAKERCTAIQPVPILIQPPIQIERRATAPHDPLPSQQGPAFGDPAGRHRPRPFPISLPAPLPLPGASLRHRPGGSRAHRRRFRRPFFGSGGTAGSTGGRQLNDGAAARDGRSPHLRDPFPHPARPAGNRAHAAVGSSLPEDHQCAARHHLLVPCRPGGLQRLFPLLPLPLVAGVLDSSPLLQDRLFGWERLAGANPVMLRNVRHIPPREPVRECIVDAVLHWLNHRRGLAGASGAPGDLPPPFLVSDQDVARTLPGETLQSLVDQGRLFFCEYSDTVGLPTGAYSSGLLGITRPKRLYSPYALFAWMPATDEEAGWLQPLAIQCDPAAPHQRVFTPGTASPGRWRRPWCNRLTPRPRSLSPTWPGPTSSWKPYC